MKSKQELELSRPLGIDKIPSGGMVEHIVARPTERAALAARFGLLDLPRLEADLSIDHAEGHTINVSGSISADIVQQCVVTLEPIESKVDESVDVIFAPPSTLGNINDPGDIGHIDVMMDEEPEPIIGGVIDLGEVVAQHLALGLDPYPRKKGAALPKAEASQEKVGANNPFARLKEEMDKQ